MALRDPDGLFKKNIVGRVTFQIGRLLKPLMNVSDGVAKFATGAGKPLFNFIRSIGAMGLGNLGKIAGVFGTILRPIGFIFSFKAAYDEFVNSEKGSLLEKSTDAIGKFFGDFIGAPLDLVKSLVARLFGFIGWDAASKKLTDFSIENLLTEAFQTILDAPRAIITYLGELFIDENFRAEQLAKLKDTITNWGSNLVGWIGSILPDFSGLTDWVKEQAKNILPEGLYDYWFGEDEVSMDTGPSSRDGSYRKKRKAEKNAIEEEKAALAGLAQFAGEDMILSYQEARKAMNKDLIGFREAVRPYAELVGKDVGTYTRELASGAFNKQGLDLRLPQNPAGGANATVIDNSSRNSSTQNTGLLLNGGPAIDNFTPY